jgi:carboxyl-terminal processing protease
MKIFNRRILGAGLLAVLVISLLVFTARYERLRAYEDIEQKLEIYLKALEIVKNEYLQKDLDNTKLVYGSIKGMLESLNDPYTRFMEPKAFEEMNIRMSGSYGGVGIYIGIKDSQIVVISPIKDTPAAKIGLKSKDKIMTIDGKPTKNMALDEAVSIIRGPKGSKVVLGILRNGWPKAKDFSLAREEIIIKSVETKSLSDNMFYIKLNTFENQNSGADMARALKEANSKSAKGLVLDLRNNGGGLLRMAVDIASMFIKDGVIVYTVDRDGRRETLSSTGKVIWAKPVVVLVNESSASASEILAGALMDDGIATIVGTHTFGKAYVQNVRTLDDGSAILVTVAKYYTPSGHDISEKGIIPNVLIEMPEISSEEAQGEEINIKEEDDVQLKKAVEILKGRLTKASKNNVLLNRPF